MYSSAIQLKDLTIRIGLQYELYHQVTAYDHVIAYARLTFVITDMEVIINYLAARKSRHEKRHFSIICHALHVIGCTILYFIRPHLVFIMGFADY